MMDDYAKLAEAIRSRGGDCTAAESFIPRMVERIATLEAQLADARGEVERLTRIAAMETLLAIDGELY